MVGVPENQTKTPTVHRLLLLQARGPTGFGLLFSLFLSSHVMSVVFRVSWERQKGRKGRIPPTPPPARIADLSFENETSATASGSRQIAPEEGGRGKRESVTIETKRVPGPCRRGDVFDGRTNRARHNVVAGMALTLVRLRPEEEMELLPTTPRIADAPPAVRIITAAASYYLARLSFTQRPVCRAVLPPLTVGLVR